MDSVGDHLDGGVSPFGDPRINECSPLPVAFRSVLRPSSPLGAKASTRCPFALDLSHPRDGASSGPATNRADATLAPGLGTRSRASASRAAPRPVGLAPHVSSHSDTNRHHCRRHPGPGLPARPVAPTASCRSLPSSPCQTTSTGTRDPAVPRATPYVISTSGSLRLRRSVLVFFLSSSSVLPPPAGPLPATRALGAWWRRSDLNRRPPACKAGALPLSYAPGSPPGHARPGSWWAREDLNFRPHAYQARALTN